MVHADILGITYRNLQGIAEYFSGMPNFPMKKPAHIGEKLKKEAEERGLKPADVAAIFGVRGPSVYDWYAHGRIHKKHYPKLVQWSGRPLAYWLDMPEEGLIAKEKAPKLYADPNPRHKVLLDLFEGLPSADQDELIKSLEEKKQHYDAVIAELTARKAGRAS